MKRKDLKLRVWKALIDGGQTEVWLNRYTGTIRVIGATDNLTANQAKWLAASLQCAADGLLESQGKKVSA